MTPLEIVRFLPADTEKLGHSAYCIDVVFKDYYVRTISWEGEITNSIEVDSFGHALIEVGKLIVKQLPIRYVVE